MTTVHALPIGRFGLLTKGSPEVVLEVCASVDREDGGRSARTTPRGAQVLEAGRCAAGSGLRVLAVARGARRHRRRPRTPRRRRDLSRLRRAGGPRAARGPEAVARCGDAGIRVVMITGDHPATGGVGRAAVGLPATRWCWARAARDDDELRDSLADPGVGARPRRARAEAPDRGRLPGAGRRRRDDGRRRQRRARAPPGGHRRGDGRHGTDVAREAADLVLLDDNFAHIVEAVEEGRAAFDNIRRFLTYHLTDNVAELAPFVLWALLGGTIPLLLSVLQVLALDIGTDLLPALALGAERPRAWASWAPPARTERTPPRCAGAAPRVRFARADRGDRFVRERPSRSRRCRSDGRSGDTLPSAALATATMSGDRVRRRSCLMQMANAFGCRSPSRSVAADALLSNRLLLLAVAVEAGALAAFLYFPPLATALGGDPPPTGGWVVVLVTPRLAFIAAEELRKLSVRRLRSA